VVFYSLYAPPPPTCGLYQRDLGTFWSQSIIFLEKKNILETNYYKGYFKPNYVFTTFLQKSDGEWVKTKNCLPYPDRGELNNIYIKSKLLFGMLCYEIAAQKNFSIHGQKKKHKSYSLRQHFFNY